MSYKIENELKMIYKMSWYFSKRHLKSCSDYWYLKPEHTRWGLETNLKECRITLETVDISTRQGRALYDLACQNSNNAYKCELEYTKKKHFVLMHELLGLPRFKK
jgi:hypothetical protein